MSFPDGSVTMMDDVVVLPLFLKLSSVPGEDVDFVDIVNSGEPSRPLTAPVKKKKKRSFKLNKIVCHCLKHFMIVCPRFSFTDSLFDSLALATHGGIQSFRHTVFSSPLFLCDELTGC